MEFTMVSKLDQATHVTFTDGEQFDVSNKMYVLKSKKIKAYGEETEEKYVIDNLGKENYGVLLCCENTLYKIQ